MIERTQVQVRMRVGSECYGHVVSFGSRIDSARAAEWAAERVARFYRGLGSRIDALHWRIAVDAPDYVFRSEWKAAEWPEQPKAE